MNAINESELNLDDLRELQQVFLVNNKGDVALKVTDDGMRVLFQMMKVMTEMLPDADEHPAEELIHKLRIALTKVALSEPAFIRECRELAKLHGTPFKD